MIAALTMIGGGERDCEGISLEEVAVESSKDETLQQLVVALRNGTEGEATDTADLKDFSRAWIHLSEKDGIILYKSRVVIPGNMRTRVLRILHSAHQGCSSMEARAKLAVWWPGIKRDIEL